MHALSGRSDHLKQFGTLREAIALKLGLQKHAPMVPDSFFL